MKRAELKETLTLLEYGETVGGLGIGELSLKSASVVMREGPLQSGMQQEFLKEEKVDCCDVET